MESRHPGAGGKKRILVFPCGSEVGLEIFRSMRYSRHFHLIGGSSIEDHGSYIYEDYVGGIPYVDDPHFESKLREIIVLYRIDAIYPAMDSVLERLAKLRPRLPCIVLGPQLETIRVCNSKSKTYELLSGLLRTPRLFASLDEVPEYPIFMKPDVGYGSRGAKVIYNRNQGEVHRSTHGEVILLEFLPGHEFTIDCFSNQIGELLFVGARKRNRIRNGISVNTYPEPRIQEECTILAKKINGAIKMAGAWFFQVKEDRIGRLCLLEVACRLGGSSALYRILGVNFALMTALEHFGQAVLPIANRYGVSLDRALSNRYKVDFFFSKIYVDLDDCLILDDKVNTELIAFLYQCHNQGRKVVLLTRHKGALEETLTKFRIRDLFHEIKHLKDDDLKSAQINPDGAIFIDDSFAERAEVAAALGIPVFSPDSVESLLQ